MGRGLFLLQSELQMPDVPRAFAWVGDSLVVCIKKDLFLISVSCAAEACQWL